jgi:hypothetical protein
MQKRNVVASRAGHFKILKNKLFLGLQNQIATGWKVRGSNTGEGEIFLTCPDWPWGPLNLMYNGYWVSIPMVKWPGRRFEHPPTSSTEVEERIELRLYLFIWVIVAFSTNATKVLHKQ